MERGKVARILIADGHLLFRRGLRTILSAEADFEVIGECSALEEAISRARQIHTDLILMDISLLETVGEGLLFALRQMQASTPILFLAPQDESTHLQLAVSAGARGYMLKSSATREVAEAIRRILAGDDPAPRVIDTVPDLQALADSNSRYARGSNLTSREQEILKLLAEGRTVRESAAELDLSVKTVEAHKLNLMRKLDIHNRAALIDYAIEKGIIQPANAA
jgi:two-component system, NarL family, response regulator NreC